MDKKIRLRSVRYTFMIQVRSLCPTPSCWCASEFPCSYSNWRWDSSPAEDPSQFGKLLLSLKVSIHSHWSKFATVSIGPTYCILPSVVRLDARGTWIGYTFKLQCKSSTICVLSGGRDMSPIQEEPMMGRLDGWENGLRVI